jgi:parallel beta-helix repeat protein
MESAINVNISSNYIGGCSKTGISIIGGNCYIEGNFIENIKLHGIATSAPSYCTIKLNTIQNCLQKGILYGQVIGFPKLIYNNTIINCGSDAISNEECSDTVIMGNVLVNNFEGISFGLANNCSVLNNTLYNSRLIKPDGTNYFIAYNNFLDYKGSFNALQYPNIIYAYNFWDDWVEPDLNGDGIVDIPYNKSFGINNYNVSDAFPQTKIYPTSNYHILNKPYLFVKTESFDYGRSFNFSWFPAQDSFGYPITNTSLYYSINNGTSWNLLVSNFFNRSYFILNSSFIPDGPCVFKLESENALGNRTSDISKIYYVHNFLGSFKFITPVNRFRVRTEDIIQWTEPHDDFGHEIDYSLYYTPDDGKTWYTIRLSEKINNNQYRFSPEIDGKIPIPSSLHARFKIIAHCSDNATQEIISTPFIFFEFHPTLFAIIATLKFIGIGGLIVLISSVQGLKKKDRFISLFNSQFQIFKQSIIPISYNRQILKYSIGIFFLFFVSLRELRAIYLQIFVHTSPMIFLAIGTITLIFIISFIKSKSKYNEPLLQLVKYLEIQIKQIKDPNTIFELKYFIGTFEFEHHSFYKTYYRKLQNLGKAFLNFEDCINLIPNLTQPPKEIKIISDNKNVQISRKITQKDVLTYKIEISNVLLHNLIHCSEKIRDILLSPSKIAVIKQQHIINFSKKQAIDLSDTNESIENTFSVIGTPYIFLTRALPYYQKWIYFASGRLELVQRLKILGQIYTGLSIGGQRLVNIAEAIKYLKLAASISHLIIIQNDKSNKINTNFSIQQDRKDQLNKDKDKKEDKYLTKIPSFIANQMKIWNDIIPNETKNNITSEIYQKTINIDNLNKNNELSVSNNNNPLKESKISSVLPDLESYLDSIKAGTKYLDYSKDTDKIIQDKLTQGRLKDAIKLLYQEQSEVINLEFIPYIMEDLADAYNIIDQYIYSIVLYENAIKGLMILKVLIPQKTKEISITSKRILKKLTIILKIKTDPAKAILKPEKLFESEADQI